MAISKNDILSVKGQGFLINRGTECFSGRIVPTGSVFSAQDLSAVAQCAQRFGNGQVAFTSRLTAEIIGIPFDKIPDAKEFMASRNMFFGGTGAKIRPITACKGTTCVYGNFDTRAMAKKIHNDYYLGWSDIKLPHKFKIGIGGCPNSCMKPSLNDFGIQGHRIPVYNTSDCKGCKVCSVELACPVKAASTNTDTKIMSIDKETCMNCGVCAGKCPFKAVKHDTTVVYGIFAGGTWGKKWRMGTQLPEYVTESQVYEILEKTMLWFKGNAMEKERLGMAMDRVGTDNFFKAILGN